MRVHHFSIQNFRGVRHLSFEEAASWDWALATGIRETFRPAWAARDG